MLIRVVNMRSYARHLLVNVLPSQSGTSTWVLSLKQIPDLTPTFLGHTVVTRVCLSSWSYHVHFAASTV